MKKRSYLYIAFALAAVLFVAGCEAVSEKVAAITGRNVTATAVPEPTAEPVPTLDRPLIVLYTNDVHCGFDTGIGISSFASARQALLNSDCYVVTVDAGDFVQGEPIGTLSEGESPIKVMNTLGYDLAVPGNHDFDYGVEGFKSNTELAEFPYLCCNLFWKATGERIFDAYRIMNFNGVRVAFVGILTPRTENDEPDMNLLDANGNPVYDFGRDETGERLYGIVQEAVDAARADGAQYVIAVAHCGIGEEAMPWTSSEIIANTTGIDAWIDGHSHSIIESETVKNRDGKNVLLTQTGTKTDFFGMLTIKPLGGISAKLIDDNGVGQKIDDLMAEHDAMLKETLGTTEYDLVINDPKQIGVRIVRSTETNVADLVTDAFRVVSGADIGIINGGGVRSAIEAGDITYEDILCVLPFNDEITVIEATGQQILDMLEVGAELTPKEKGGFLQVSGLTYEIHTYIESSVTYDAGGNSTGVEGEYRVKNVMVGGEPLDLDRIYTVAGSHKLLTGQLDGNTATVGAKILRDGFMQDDMILKQYLGEYLNGVVPEEYRNPYGQERIIAVEKKPKG